MCNKAPRNRRVKQDRRIRRWRSVVRGGDGPFVPVLPARAALRRLASLLRGARVCLGDIASGEVEEACADLQISFSRDERGETPAFERVLGSEFANLPKRLRDTHGPEVATRLTGRARVTRERSVFGRVIAACFGFPVAAFDLPVEVWKLRAPDGERWERRFGRQVFRSHLSVDPAGRMRERFGPMWFEPGLKVEDEALHFPVLRGWALGVPLP